MQYQFMRFPGGRAKAVTFSYDDGVPQDQRLAALFDRFGVKATFNFTAKPHFTKEQIHEYFLSRGHEIAVHGAEHRANGNLRAIEGIRDALDCRLVLEDLCDRIIRGMAYPDSGIRLMGRPGNSYEKIKEYLKELDIVYARTVGENLSFELPADFHAWFPTIHHGHPRALELIDEFLELDTSAKAYHSRRTPRLFYIWGHSYEFVDDDNWDVMEELFAFIGGREDIWYCTNIEFFELLRAYQSLEYFADGSKVYNPTAIPVELSMFHSAKDWRAVKVLPGETADLK